MGERRIEIYTGQKLTALAWRLAFSAPRGVLYDNNNKPVTVHGTFYVKDMNLHPELPYTIKVFTIEDDCEFIMTFNDVQLIESDVAGEFPFLAADYAQTIRPINRFGMKELVGDSIVHIIPEEGANPYATAH